MCEACSDAKWIGTFLAELGFTLNRPSKLFCYNTVANTWAESSDSMKRAKHIDLKFHFVKESTTAGIIKHEDIDLKNNPADSFTKPLMKTKFELSEDLIGIRPWQ